MTRKPPTLTVRRKLPDSEKTLIRRYLVWCYKTTREDLDRIDRKFTQLTVDDFILTNLEKISGPEGQVLNKSIEGFKVYIDKKKESALAEKFSDPHRKQLQPQYLYLCKRLSAVESAVRFFLGPQELGKIRTLYESEMTTRILQAREH